MYRRIPGEAHRTHCSATFQCARWPATTGSTAAGPVRTRAGSVARRRLLARLTQFVLLLNLDSPQDVLELGHLHQRYGLQLTADEVRVYCVMIFKSDIDRLVPREASSAGGPTLSDLGKDTKRGKTNKANRAPSSLPPAHLIKEQGVLLRGFRSARAETRAKWVEMRQA